MGCTEDCSCGRSTLGTTSQEQLHHTICRINWGTGGRSIVIGVTWCCEASLHPHAVLLVHVPRAVFPPPYLYVGPQTMVFRQWWGTWQTLRLYRCCFACKIFQVTLVPSVGEDSARTCLICRPRHFHLLSLLPLKSMPSCRIPGAANGSTPSSQTSLVTLLCSDVL